MTETTKSHDTRRRVIAPAQRFRLWALRRPMAALALLLGAAWSMRTQKAPLWAIVIVLVLAGMAIAASFLTVGA